MGRHRHAVSVRTDGLAAVLGPLLDDGRVRSAALVDVDSGMVLDVCGPDTGQVSPVDGTPHDEVRAAAHAELVRIGLALGPGAGGAIGLVLEAGPDRHVLHTVPDPHGGRLALSVVVRGPDRVVAKVRRRLRAVSGSALTAGPSTAVRPGSTGWALPGGTAAGPGATGAGDGGPNPAAQTVRLTAGVAAATPTGPAGPAPTGPADPGTTGPAGGRGPALSPSGPPPPPWAAARPAPERPAPPSAMLPGPPSTVLPGNAPWRATTAPAAPADPAGTVPADR